MIDLNDHLQRKKLTLQMYDDVDKFCREHFTEDPRTHMGASVIGDDCLAKAWNSFRWLKFEDLTGQKLRLFNRGHREEERFVTWLVGMGFEVREFDPETKKQFRILGCKGHFGGSLDALMKAPERYGVGDLVWLGEFKTHNEKSFTKLAGPKPPWKELGVRPRVGGKGVIGSKPMHFKQMCSYGRGYNIEWGIYCAVNKDTDELYFEIVKLDFNQADDLFRKADSIIFSQTRPMKIAQTPEFIDCKLCDFAGLCHGNEVPTKNCRSCSHAFPVDDAQWFCEINSPEHGPIPKDVIAKGCPSYARIA